MEYIWDAPFADRFVCNGELHWHDYYYISPRPPVEDSLIYRLNRTGIESRTPEIFHVERSESTPYCQIFCVMSGKGRLFYEGRDYALHEKQMVLLNSKRAHMYESNPQDPFGIVWMEFYGADASRLMEHLIRTQSPVIEGLWWEKSVPFWEACSSGLCWMNGMILPWIFIGFYWPFWKTEKQGGMPVQESPAGRQCWTLILTHISVKKSQINSWQGCAA